MRVGAAGRSRRRTVGGVGLAAVVVGVSTIVLRSCSAPAPVDLTFHRDPSNGPVVAAGNADTPMLVMDPCVIRDDEGYHLFYCTYCRKTDAGLSVFAEPDELERFDPSKLTTAIGYGSSSDAGLTWTFRSTPVLAPGEAEWESFRVETPNVVVVEDVLYLFYCADGTRDGKPFRTRYQIGAAQLALNGGTIRGRLLTGEQVLTRPRTEPILPYVTDEASYRNNVQEPSVLFVEDHFELYFIGLRLALPGEAIGGNDKQRIRGVGLGRAILNRRIEVERATPEPLKLGVNLVEVERGGGRYYLFSATAGFWGAGPIHEGTKISCYASPDGLTWSRPSPVLGPAATGFDDWATVSPTVVREPDRFVLFYTAFGASAPQPGRRWGIPLPDGRCVYGALGRAVSTPDGPRRRRSSGERVGLAPFSDEAGDPTERRRPRASRNRR